MSPPASVPTTPSIAEFAAPALFGYVWNWALYGILVVQFYVYSYNFPEDRKFLKLLVYVILLIDTAQTVLLGIDMYYRFASGFGSIEHLTDPYLSPFYGPIIGAILSLIIQYFFAYRIWVLSNKTSFWLCTLICMFSTLDSIAAFIGSIYVFVRGRFVSSWMKPLVFICRSTDATANILITIGMVYHLSIRPIRQINMGVSSSHALSKIVRLTVETNVLTTTTGIVSLLLLAIFPDKMYHAFPGSLLGKLYSNTLLVSLNNRISIRREGLSGRETLPTSKSTIDFSPGVVHVEFKDETARVSRSSGDEAYEGPSLEEVSTSE